MSIKYQTQFTESTTPEGIEEAIRTMKLMERKIESEIKRISRVFDAEMAEKKLKVWVPVQLRNVFSRNIEVSFNLGYVIEKIAVLRENKWDNNDRILIRKEGVQCIIPRGGNGYCGAQCSPDSLGEISAFLIITVLRNDRRRKYPLLDRGVCWVTEGGLGKPGIVILNLQNIDKHLAKGEITDILKEVEEKVNQTLDGIFKLSQSTKV